MGNSARTDAAIRQLLDEAGCQQEPCSLSSVPKYENRGGEIWEWDGQKWRELFASDAIQRLDYYERKIATLDSNLQTALNAIRFASDRFDRVSWGWEGDCGSKDIIATLEDILPENA
jgi:hypothetical protein